MPHIKNEDSDKLIQNLNHDEDDLNENELMVHLGQKLFKAIIDNSSDIVLILNRKGIIQYVNHALEPILGIKSNKLLHKNISNFVSSESMESIRKLLNSENKDFNTFKIKMCGKNSRTNEKCEKGHILEITAQNFLPDPTIKAVVIKGRVVTSERRYGGESWYSETISEFIENIPEPVIIIDENGDVLLTNTSISYFMGLETPFDFTGMNIVDHVQHDYVENVIKDLTISMKTGDPFLARYKIRAFNGEEKWIETQGKNIIFNGHSARMVTIRDITQRKNIEKQLKESEESLRIILNSVNDAIFIHDLEGTIIDFNQKMLDMYGVSEDEATFFSIMEDYSSSENPIHKLPEIWKRVISGKTEVFEWKATRPKDGSLFDVEVFLRKIRLKDKDYILATVSDITERKNVERQIRLSLQQKDLLIEEIYRRTQLSLYPISSLIELQMEYFREDNLKEFYKENLNRQRLIARINKQLSALENNARIDFKEFVQDIIQGLFDLYKVDQNEIKININGNILMDIDLVVPCGLIINELVSNSIKHAFNEGDSGKIDIKLHYDDGRVLLSVKDDGIGLPKDVDIFNTKTLGFKLVNILLEQLSGTIELKRDNGTLFEIEIWTLDMQKFWNN